MRRYNAPYFGKEYLLNTNTGEIHDLDNEDKDNCKINKISVEHVVTFSSIEQAFRDAHLFTDKKLINGCAHCLPNYDLG